LTLYKFSGIISNIFFQEVLMIRFITLLLVLLTSTTFALTNTIHGQINNGLGQGLADVTLTDRSSGNFITNYGDGFFDMIVTSPYYVIFSKEGYDTVIPPCGFGYIMTVTMKKVQTISLNSIPEKTYGDAPFTLTATSKDYWGNNTGIPLAFINTNPSVASLSGNTVTIIKPGTTLFYINEDTSALYSLSHSMTGKTLIIQPKALTITADNKNKLTDAPDPTWTVSYSGFITGENVSNLSGTLVLNRTPGENAGSYSITPSGLSSSNYNITYVTGSLMISNQSQTITFNSLSRPFFGYNAGPFNLTATASSGLPVSYVSSNTSVATVSGSTVTIYGAGTTTITASQAGNTTYDAAPPVNQDLIVFKGFQILDPLGITGPKIYGDVFNLTATTASTAGLVVNYTSSNTSVATVSGNTITAVGVGSTDIQATQPGNANYVRASDSTRTLTIQAKVLTIAGMIAADKVYNGDNSATVSGGSLSGIVGSDDVTFSITSSTFNDATTGNSKPVSVAVTLQGTKAGNYSIVSPIMLTANITAISKINQTITFTSLPNKTYGETSPFLLTASSSSGLPVSFSSSNTSVASITGSSTVTILSGGTTTITASQAGNETYNPAPNVSQILTVAKINQTITFTSLPNKTYGETSPFLLMASSSSGLPVSFSSSNTFVASITGSSTVTILSGGTTTITASQAGNEIYNPALNVSQILTVAKSTMAGVSMSNLKQSCDGTPKSVTVTTYPNGLAVIVTYNGSSTVPINAGSYAVKATINDVSYQGSGDTTFTILTSSGTVTLSGLTATYDGLQKNVSAATNPVSLPVTITYNGSSTAPTNVGSYAVVATINDVNYQGSASGSLVISKCPQTITFNALPDKAYNDGPYNLTAEATSGLPISYRSSNLSIAKITNNVVMIFGAGLDTITAYQNGDTNHLTASSVQQVLRVIGNPVFTSSDTALIRGGTEFSYKVTYLIPGNPLMYQDTILSKPSWLSMQGDSLYGTAPKVNRNDTVKIKVSAGSVSNTLVLVLHIRSATVGTLAGMQAKKDCFGISSMSNSICFGVNAGAYSIAVYDLAGRVMFSQMGTGTEGFNQRILVNRNVYVIKLNQGQRSLITKLQTIR
jgi:hypothetical protein